MVEVARGDAGTVHKFPADSDAPECGTITLTGSHRAGALKRQKVDIDEIDPWNLCQKCFPQKYKKYPENDHWFDVKGAHEWKGKLGEDFTCFVECNCGFTQPCSSKSEAYAVGYDHKRYPERSEDDESGEKDSIIETVESAEVGDVLAVNDLSPMKVTNVKDQYDSPLADGVLVTLDQEGEEFKTRTFPDGGSASVIGEGGIREKVESVSVE